MDGYIGNINLEMYNIIKAVITVVICRLGKAFSEHFLVEVDGSLARKYVLRQSRRAEH